MRTSAMFATIVALALTGTILRADDDFSALLADLSFGESALPAQTLSIAQDEPVEQLHPVPTGLAMPGMIESNDVPDVGSESPRGQVASAATDAGVGMPSVTPTIESVVTEAPQVALQNPIPVVSGRTNVAAQAAEIDLESAFALQDPIDATPVGHHIRRHCDQTACEPEIRCRMRTQVRLPSSTLLQYFRSHPCYTNVWDGYNWDCGEFHTHLHGECDCFTKDHDCDGNGCTSCDGRHAK